MQSSTILTATLCLLCLMMAAAASTAAHASHMSERSGDRYVASLSAVKAARFHAQYHSYEEFVEHMSTYHLLTTTGSSCHNATGACYSPDRGYLCLSGELVSHSDRCDGIEDCVDGTDELMCDHPSEALDGSAGQRRTFMAQFAAPTCNGCACSVGGPMEVSTGNPYFEMALSAKMTPEFSDEAPVGRRCNPEETTTMMIRMYKKSGFCRKAICCIRQSACVRCNSTDVTPLGKCHENITTTK